MSNIVLGEANAQQRGRQPRPVAGAYANPHKQWEGETSDGGSASVEPRRGGRRGGRTRPKGALDTSGVNAAVSPLGDPSALPKGAGFTVKWLKALQVQEYADSLPPASKAQGEAWDVIRSLERCGLATMPGGGWVGFNAGKDTAAFVSGVLWCQRWCCPCCGTFAQRRRREALVEQAPVVAAAGRTFLFTPTVRHRMGVRYVALRQALGNVTRRMKKHRQWRSVLADVRADEVTYGTSGFHLHKHILLTLPRTADADAFRDWLRDFWEEQARLEGRTCQWPEGGDWWTEVAPERVAGAAAYLQKLGELDVGGLLSVAAGEVLGGSAKRGSEPWAMPAHAYVEMWHGSKRQRTFGVGGLWRSKKVESVEADEDAADARAQTEAAFARVERPVWRELDMVTRAWLKGSLANKTLRAEWIIRLESVFGPDLEVLCAPGETPPTSPTDGGGGCGGDAPTEAQGAAAGASEDVVAPLPVSRRQVDEAPGGRREIDRAPPKSAEKTGKELFMSCVNISPILKNPTVAPRSPTVAALCSERSEGEVAHGMVKERCSGRYAPRC